MRITAVEAAQKMGVSLRFLHLGLQRGKFPFGTAVKGEKRWSYYINRQRFEKWMAGDDLQESIKKGEENK